jgi:hypothetical protein
MTTCTYTHKTITYVYIYIYAWCKENGHSNPWSKERRPEFRIYISLLAQTKFWSPLPAPWIGVTIFLASCIYYLTASSPLNPDSGSKCSIKTWYPPTIPHSITTQIRI